MFLFTCSSGGGGDSGSADGTTTADGGGTTDDGGGTDEEDPTDDSEIPQILLNSIQFSSDSDSIILKEGLTQQLEVLGVFSDESTQDYTDYVEWSSSDSAILEIVAKGLISGKSLGTAKVTVRYGSFAAIYINVTVKAREVNSIRIFPRPESAGEKLAVSDTYDTYFIAKALYDNNTEEVLSDNVIWSSVDPSQKSLINRFSGKFTPYDSTSDNITIRAEYFGHNDEISAYINTLILESVELKIYQGTPPNADEHPDSLEIVEGETARVIAVATYQGAETITGDISSNVIWTSDNSNDASILRDGTIYDTSTNGSPVTISIDIEDIDGNNPSPVTLTIRGKTLTSILFTPSYADVVKGAQFQLFATGYYDNGTSEDLTSSGSNSEWYSSNTGILQVNSSENRGFVTAQQSVGSAQISVKKCKDGGDDCYQNEDDYLTATKTITVHDQTLSSIKILTSGISRDIIGTGTVSVNFTEPVPEGLLVDMTVIGYYEGGAVSEMDLSKDGNIKFSVAGTDLSLCSEHDSPGRTTQCFVKIENSSASGVVTAEYTPTGLVTDADNDLSITATDKQILSFDIYEGASARTSLSLIKNNSKQLRLHRKYSNGDALTEDIDTNSGINWEFSTDGVNFSTDSDRISIDSSGNLTGETVGTVVLKALVNGYAGVLSRLISIEVFPSEITLNEEYIGIIDIENEIYLTFDFPEAGDYTFTFISEEKSVLSDVNPGSTWFFMDDPFHECELGHAKPRVSIPLSAGSQTFGFDNLDEDEGGELTVFSLRITSGGGYDCE